MAQATRAELEQRIEEQDSRIARLEADLGDVTHSRNLWRLRCREILSWAT